MHLESYHQVPHRAYYQNTQNATLSTFRFRGQCSPEQAQSRVIQLEDKGYINIRCDQVNSGWFDGGLPTYLITAESKG